MSEQSDAAIRNVITVKLDGVELPNELSSRLGACWVELSVNVPSIFHLTFRDAHHLLMQKYPPETLMGAPVTVYMIADSVGKDTPLITGKITGLETDFDGATYTTVIRGVDHAFKMMREYRTEGYRDMTATAIVTELAGRDGVAVGEVESSGVVYDLITQPNISDWQFVNELAERSGMVADFDNLGLLRFRKVEPAAAGAVSTGPDPAVLTMGEDVLTCRTGITAADQVSAVQVRGWDQEKKEKLKAINPNPTYSGVDIGIKPSEAAIAFGLTTLSETSTPYRSQSEVNQAVDSLASDIASSFAELEIQVRGNPELVPGKPVTLKDAGAPFDGKYTVTAARHEFSATNYYGTWIMVSGRQVRSVYGLAAGAGSSTPRIPGVVNAIVENIDDPLNQGRVQVSFPWFDDTYKTEWARTLQFGGKGGGGVISPAAGDEVLVAFDRGDIDYPYVLGGLYSTSENKPSVHDVADVVTGGHLNRQSIVSRNGHRLELIDATAQEKNGVRLQNGAKTLTVYLDEIKTEIQITSDGKISISGKEAVSITSAADVSVDAGGSVSVKAASVSVEAASISLTGDVSVKGPLNIVGPLTVAGPTVNFMVSEFSVIAGGLVNMTGTLTTIQGIPAPYIPAPA